MEGMVGRGFLGFYVVEHILREEGDRCRKGYARGARVSRNVFVFICQGGCIRDAGKRRLPVNDVGRRRPPVS